MSESNKNIRECSANTIFSQKTQFNFQLLLCMSFSITQRILTYIEHLKKINNLHKNTYSES